MGEAQVTKEQMFIIDYVKDHFQGWMEEKRIIPFPSREPELNTQLFERVVRIEEGIKHQNENIEKMMVQMDNRFMEARENSDQRFSNMKESSDQRFTAIQETMNHRFESMDKRFESMDKRFNRQGQFMVVIFAAIVTTAITVIMTAS